VARLMLICRVHEANRLRAELSVARMAEKAAREKYQDFMRTSSMYGVSVSDSVSAIQIRDIFTVIQIVLYSWLKVKGPDIYIPLGNQNICGLQFKVVV